MSDKDVLVISTYHCASTSLNHNIGKILNKNFINDWDKNKYPDKIFNVRKIHPCKSIINNYIDFLKKVQKNDIIVIPFRKKSKILKSGFLQALTNKSLNIKLENTQEYLEYFKIWINDNKNKSVYNIKYLNNLKKEYFSSQKFENNYIKKKTQDSTIYLVDTDIEIKNELFEDIYEEYFNVKYTGKFIQEKVNVTKKYFNKKKPHLEKIDYDIFTNLIEKDKDLQNLFDDFDKDYYNLK